MLIIFLLNLKSDSPFYCNARSVHLEKATDKNLVEKGTKLYKKTHYSQVPKKRGIKINRGGGKFLKILINGGVKINGGGNFLKNLINI